MFQDPESTEAMTKLAMIYEFELVRYDDAEELYKRAMALAPDDVSMIYDYAVFLQVSFPPPISACARPQKGGRACEHRWRVLGLRCRVCRRGEKTTMQPRRSTSEP